MNGNKIESTSKSNKNRRLLRTGITAAVLLTVLSISIAVEAWFYYGRSTAAISEVSDPMAMFIKAGNREDVRYIELGGIDVENQGTEMSGDKKYMDFVFCVEGSNVEYFKLQLAYTTNNQFEYEIYPATETTDPVPNNNGGYVDYTLHDGTNTVKHYYIADGTTALRGDFLNDKTVDSELLGKDNTDDDEEKRYYDMTYGTYSNHHKYAVPLYWQADEIQRADYHNQPNFYNYYILRVIWNNNAINNKETDIIYISAKNTTGNHTSNSGNG